MTMTWQAFQCQVPGKWVLTGEHSVLRGATALALPHPEFAMELVFTPGERSGEPDGLQVLPSPEAKRVVLELLGAVRDLREANGKTFRFPKGILEIRSSIPIGAGLGSSAALCVAMARWLAEPLQMEASEILSFATELEHRFHGRSSGMDIAVIAFAEPISFVMGRGARALSVLKIPKFTFHDTGLRTRTSEAVMQVERLKLEKPHLSMQIDEAMAGASRGALEGLVNYDSDRREVGLEQLARAMKQAQECFLSWQLVPAEAKRLQGQLQDEGALATKLTGAGGGGMVVALWPETPQN